MDRSSLRRACLSLRFFNKVFLDKDGLMTSAATACIGEPSAVAVPSWMPSAWDARRPAPARPGVNDAAVIGLVGANLRRLRRQHRISLEELARQSGVSRAMIGQVEQGKSMPSIKTLWQVAQALGVSVAWFLEPDEGRHVLLIPAPEQSPEILAPGEGELRSLLQAGDVLTDAFYELRLAAGGALSLPASTQLRRVNVAVATGTLQVEVNDTRHQVHPREALQYGSAEALVWRNLGQVQVQAFVTIRSVA
jgi:transcriptional regulator with XRE-family HTH domain